MLDLLVHADLPSRPDGFVGKRRKKTLQEQAQENRSNKSQNRGENFAVTRRIRAPSGSQIDLRDKPAMEKLFASTKFDAVIHFAGLKAVGESVEKPLLYFNNNLIGTITPKEGIVLGHKISENGIEVDKVKVEVIANLPPPTSMKAVRSFLGHALL